MKNRKYSLNRLFAFLLFIAFSHQVLAQQPSISERKKVRYLKKIERKNDRYIRHQEKSTRKALSKLTEKEKILYQNIDSTKLDSSFFDNSFSKLEEKFLDGENSENLVSKISKPVSVNKTISFNIIPENLDGTVKDYLKQQITASSFLSDSNCINCAKLKKQAVKAKANLEKTSEKLRRLKSIESDIKKHQETLKNYGVSTPSLTTKLKEINKTCYYFAQGSNSFKDLYSNPTKGIETSVLKNLSINRDFKIFQSQFSNLPISTTSLSGIITTPDMTGYQTKAQVQAMLPQNASGLTPEIKSHLISNMQHSLIKFTDLRNDKPNLSMFRDKPEFKINPYKGIPLRSRLVPGVTFQPQIKKLNEPITIDLGVTLGFKLTQRLTPMIGTSAKVGLGESIQHLNFSHRGIVAKAGFDTKLFYGFSIQSWYEATWKAYSSQYTIENNKTNFAQTSLIAGICNTYKISKKVNGTFLIGYDFFYNKHTPYSSPWVIRMGWQ